MKKLLLSDFYEDEKDIVQDDDNELYIRYYSTAVMCHIKTFKWADAVKTTIIVLGVEGYDKNLKVLYRRSLAKLNTGSLHKFDDKVA